MQMNNDDLKDILNEIKTKVSEHDRRDVELAQRVSVLETSQTFTNKIMETLSENVATLSKHFYKISGGLAVLVVSIPILIEIINLYKG